MAKGRGFLLVLEGIEAMAAVGKEPQDLTVVDMVAAATRAVAVTATAIIATIGTTATAIGVAASELIELIELIEVIEVIEVDTRRIVMIENVMNAKKLKV